MKENFDTESMNNITWLCFVVVVINYVFFSHVLGMIDVEELIKAFKDLGVEVDKNEAMKLLQR